MQRAELTRLSGSDPVLKRMLDRNLPLDRQTYLDLAYAGGMPQEWTAEHEHEVPEPFRLT